MAYASDESMFEYLNVVSKMFDSETEGYEFYNKYALEKGFSVRKSYVEWDGSNKYIISCLLRSHRRISDEQKADIADMEKCGIRKYRIMDILCFQYGGFDKVGCIKRDIYNFC